MFEMIIIKFLVLMGLFGLVLLGAALKESAQRMRKAAGIAMISGIIKELKTESKTDAR